jgi:hypothetical protein
VNRVLLKMKHYLYPFAYFFTHLRVSFSFSLIVTIIATIGTYYLLQMCFLIPFLVHGLSISLARGCFLFDLVFCQDNIMRMLLGNCRTGLFGLFKGCLRLFMFFFRRFIRTRTAAQQIELAIDLIDECSVRNLNVGMIKQNLMRRHLFTIKRLIDVGARIENATLKHEKRIFKKCN